jgi:hypothetical protein
MGRFFCFYTKLSQSPANARKLNNAEQQQATKSNKKQQNIVYTPGQ